MSSKTKAKKTEHLARYDQRTGQEDKSLYQVLPLTMARIAFDSGYMDPYRRKCRRIELLGATPFSRWWSNDTLVTYPVMKVGELFDLDRLFTHDRAWRTRGDACREGHQ